MPDFVIAGLPSWAYRTHSWAGLALGWIHRPASLLAEMPYGRGQMGITTFKLNAHTLAEDVVAQSVLAGALQLHFLTTFALDCLFDFLFDRELLALSGSGAAGDVSPVG